MKPKLFKVDFNGMVLAGDSVRENTPARWLFLHGAGSGNRERFEQLRALLAHKGITSCSFDFIGHGETGGNLTGSSLENRVAQASAIIDSGAVSQPLSVVASSMGGYVAVKLTELYKVKNLILLAPAVYTAKACSIPFGLLFTKVIRSFFSWRGTDAWEILENYKGNLLVYVAEKDQVVPHEITEGVYNSARNAKSKEMIIVKDAAHSLAKWLDERPDSLHNVIQKISELSELVSK